MTKITRTLLGLALAVAGGAGPAAAQQITSPYRFIDESQYVGVAAGYMVTSPGTIGLGAEDAPYAALRYGIRVSGPFVLEGEAGFLPSSRAVLLVDTLASDSANLVTTRVGEGDLSLLLLSGALRFDLTGPRTYHRLLPYLVFGVGGAIDLAGEADADAELPADNVFDFGTSFAGHIGGGLEWFPTSRLTLRLDLRDVLWQIQAPEGFALGDAPLEEWVQNFQITAGLSFRF